MALEAGAGRCGTAATLAVQLLERLGIKARVRPLPCGHIVAEVFYGDVWHILDPLILRDQLPERDGRVLSVDELLAEPYFADSLPQPCFVYEPEELRSADGFYMLGYCFGEWGANPFYSTYLGAPRDYPPTLPITLPAERVDERTVRLRWAESIKRNGGPIEYRLRIYGDRSLKQLLLDRALKETSWLWQPPEQDFMYYYLVRAMDDHRLKNEQTWYPSSRGNFVLSPLGRYGWYGVI